MPVFALELDTSVDDEIRRNYNPSKLEEDMALPALPKILKEDKQSVQPVYKPISQTASKPVYTNVKPISQIQYKNSLQSIKEPSHAVLLKQGTKFRLKLATSISDRCRRGSKISFISRYPVTTTYMTIPIGTTFTGEIIEAHKPQLAGNGGLIVMKVNSMILGDGSHPIEAEVTEINSKKVFFNTVKGKRKYVKNMLKSTKPGFYFFRKMLMATANLAQDGTTIMITPFSLLLGFSAVAGNIAASPVLALFYKGDSLYIKEGSDIEIQLTQDVYIYN